MIDALGRGLPGLIERRRQPSHENSLRGERKRCQSPPSSRCTASAVSVSIAAEAAQPGDRRPQPLVGASRQRRSSSASCARSARRRRASRSMNASSVGSLLERWPPASLRCARVPRRRAVIDAAVHEQQLRDAVARAHQIAADLLARAREVTRSPPTNSDGTATARQLPGHHQPGKQLGVLAIGLDPIPAGRGGLARRDHLRARARPHAPPDRARTRSDRPHRPHAPGPAARPATPPPPRCRRRSAPASTRP